MNQEVVEYVIKADKTVITRHQNDEMPFGPSSNESFTNFYKKIRDVDGFLSNYNVEIDILDFYNLQKNENEERIKVYRPDDYFNVAKNLNLPEYDVYMSSFYVVGPKNLVDFYFVPKNEADYKTWLENHNYEFLELPENSHPYVFCVTYDLDTKNLVTHKRYASPQAKNISREFFTFLKSQKLVHPGGNEVV